MLMRVLASGATGVCCHNDRVAMGLYDALRDRERRFRMTSRSWF